MALIQPHPQNKHVTGREGQGGRLPSSIITIAHLIWQCMKLIRRLVCVYALPPKPYNGHPTKPADRGKETHVVWCLRGVGGGGGRSQRYWARSILGLAVTDDYVKYPSEVEYYPYCRNLSRIQHGSRTQPDHQFEYWWIDFENLFSHLVFPVYLDCLTGIDPLY